MKVRLNAKIPKGGAFLKNHDFCTKKVVFNMFCWQNANVSNKGLVIDIKMQWDKIGSSFSDKNANMWNEKLENKFSENRI